MFDRGIERGKQNRGRRFDDGIRVAPRVNRGLRLLGRSPDRARQHAIELPEHLNGNQRGFARSVFEDVESDRSLPALVNVFRIDQAFVSIAMLITLYKSSRVQVRGMCSPFCERRRLNNAARTAARTRSSALIGTSLATGFPWLVMTNDCPARTRPSSFENSRLASAAEIAAATGGLLMK